MQELLLGASEKFYIFNFGDFVKKKQFARTKTFPQTFDRLISSYGAETLPKYHARVIDKRNFDHK